MTRLNRTMLIAKRPKPDAEDLTLLGLAEVKLATPIGDDLGPDDEPERGGDQRDKAGPEQQLLVQADFLRRGEVIRIRVHRSHRCQFPYKGVVEAGPGSCDTISGSATAIGTGSPAAVRAVTAQPGAPGRGSVLRRQWNFHTRAGPLEPGGRSDLPEPDTGTTGPVSGEAAGR